VCTDTGQLVTSSQLADQQSRDNFLAQYQYFNTIGWARGGTPGLPKCAPIVPKGFLSGDHAQSVITLVRKNI